MNAEFGEKKIVTDVLSSASGYLKMPTQVHSDARVPFGHGTRPENSWQQTPCFAYHVAYAEERLSFRVEIDPSPSTVENMPGAGWSCAVNGDSWPSPGTF